MLFYGWPGIVPIYQLRQNSRILHSPALKRVICSQNDKAPMSEHLSSVKIILKLIEMDTPENFSFLNLTGTNIMYHTGGYWWQLKS